MPSFTQIQLRRDTAATWTAVNPVLAVGEPGFETDTGKEKRGDGVTAWNSLLYITDISRLAPAGTLGQRVVVRSDGTIKWTQPPAVYLSAYSPAADGATDDSAKIQAAGNAAIALGGKLVIEASAAGYAVATGLTFQPASGTNMQLDIEVQGAVGTSLVWTGANNASVIHTKGMRFSRWSGVKVRLGASASGVVAFDVDVDTTYTSSSSNNFTGCHVQIDNGAASCVGWRCGHSGLDTSDMSSNNWHTCHVDGAANNSHTAWVWENLGCVEFTWTSCSTLDMQYGWTAVATAGSAGGGFGGGQMTWIGCGGTANTNDFRWRGDGTVIGGRFEGAAAGAPLEINGFGTATVNATFVGVLFENYVPTAGTPPTGYMFNLGFATRLVLKGCRFQSSSVTTFGNSFFWLGCGASGNIEIIVEGCSLGWSTARPTVPPATLANGTTTGQVRIKLIGNDAINNTGGVVGALSDGEWFALTPRQGTATLVGGTVTVTNASVTANSRVQLTRQGTAGANPGAAYESARTAGTSFAITSTSATDTGVVAWALTEN